MPCIPNAGFAPASTGEAAATCCWPKTINLPSPRISRCSSPSRLLTVAIGAPPAPARRAMDGSKSANWWSVPTSTTSWAGVAQAFQLTRTICDQGETRIEVVYGITNLSPKQASAKRLLQLVRDHWKIENRLHWRRDVTLREDQCQVRKGQAPRVLANLNSFLLGLLDFLGISNVPQQMRFFDANPLQAVRLLLGSLLTFK